MIRHIVLFKIKDEYKSEIPQLVKNFYGMKGKIEGMTDLEAGADFLHSDRSFDVCLYVTLESPEALEAYQQDPYHCEVVKTYVASVREKAVAVDYIV